MRRRNSVFHDLLKRVPRAAFDRLVAARGADRGVRRLRSRDRLIALLYGQLSGANSLREIVGGLHSHKARLYHAGARAVQRSTLAGANAKRPAGLFAELFAGTVGGARRGLRRKIGAAACPIDATGVRRRSRPAPLASSVFDLGYYDFAWWAALDAAGWRIVTRFKSNTPLTASTERALPEDANILSDRLGLLAQRQARSRKNPFSRPAREVRVGTDTGKVLRILSNDLEAPARDIADLCKRRRAIELFFKWIEQTLKIEHFPGASENAVRIQGAVAPIAYLLLRLAKADRGAVKSPLAFARLVRANLMHGKRIDQLNAPRIPPPEHNNQTAKQWPQT